MPKLFTFRGKKIRNRARGDVSTAAVASSLRDAADFFRSKYRGTMADHYENACRVMWAIGDSRDLDKLLPKYYAAVTTALNRVASLTSDGDISPDECDIINDLFEKDADQSGGDQEMMDALRMKNTLLHSMVNNARKRCLDALGENETVVRLERLLGKFANVSRDAKTREVVDYFYYARHFALVRIVFNAIVDHYDSDEATTERAEALVAKIEKQHKDDEILVRVKTADALSAKLKRIQTAEKKREERKENERRRANIAKMSKQTPNDPHAEYWDRRRRSEEFAKRYAPENRRS